MIRIFEKQQRDENTACEETEAKGKAETNLSVTKILKENNSFFVSNWLNKRRNRKIIIKALILVDIVLKHIIFMLINMSIPIKKEVTFFVTP